MLHVMVSARAPADAEDRDENEQGDRPVATDAMSLCHVVTLSLLLSDGAHCLQEINASDAYSDAPPTHDLTAN